MFFLLSLLDFAGITSNDVGLVQGLVISSWSANHEQVRRDQYSENQKVREQLQKGDVIINLTQNVDFINVAGNDVPCILTKSFMWSMKANRPMLWQELLHAQGIPMFENELEAAGIPCPIQLDLGRCAGTKLAGNGFHISCAGSFIGFVLSQLAKKTAT